VTGRTGFWTRLQQRLAGREQAGAGAADPASGAPDRNPRRRLRRQLLQRRRAAVRLLSAGDTEAAGRELAWIEHAEKVLATDSGRVRLGLGVAVLCLVLVSIGIAWRPGGVPVAIDARVEALTLRLAAAWTAPPGRPALAARGLELSGDVALASAGVELPANAFAVTLRSLASAPDRLRLRADRLSTGAVLGLDAGREGPTAAVGGGSLEGRIEAQGVQIELEAGQGAATVELTRSQPELLRFALGGHPDNPGELRVASDQPWGLDGLRVDRLRFEREAGGQGRYLSTLVGGEVRVLATESTIALRGRDRLDLGTLRDGRLRIGYEPDQQQYRIRFEGRVQRLRTGPEGFARNRAPTLLERVYHQQQLALLWGAAVFLWGLFWGVRGWLRG
jgi:hypothetical protein